MPTSPRMPRQRRGIKPPLCKGGPALAAKQVPLGCIAPHTAQRCHSEPVTDVTGVGIRSPFHASGGLFSFSSERKEEKKRRQKLRFWISLRDFTWFLFCLLLPHERCSVQISPKVTPHNGTRAICEQILRTDEARFRSNTCRIARNRNKVRTQNFRKAPQFSLCGVALNVALSLLLGALPLLL